MGALPKAELVKYVDELRTYDHVFLNEQGADYFSKAFGFKARTSVVRANPNDMKGLTLNNGAKQARGVDAVWLAQQICGHVGIDYDEKFGRGSQLRACCDALDTWARS